MAQTLSGIQMNTTSTTTMSTSILTFNPLQTSHGNEYFCNGSLTSSASPSVLKSTQEHHVTVQGKIVTLLFKLVYIATLLFTVPAPDVIIIQLTSTHYTKTSITLMCNVTLIHEVDTETSIAVMWYRNGSAVSGTDRITLSAVSGSGHKFFSTITFSPLQESDNNTNITCGTRAIPHQNYQNFVLSSEESYDYLILTVKIKGHYKPAY